MKLTKHQIVSARLREFGLIAESLSDNTIILPSKKQLLVDWRTRLSTCVACISAQFPIKLKVTTEFGIGTSCTIVKLANPSEPIELGDNPLINSVTGNWLGAIPFDKIKKEHYLPAIKKGYEKLLSQYEDLVTNPEEPSFYNTLGHGLDINNLNDPDEDAGFILSVLSYSNADDQLDKIQEESIKLYDELVKPKLAFDRRNYDRCLHIANRAKWLNLTPAENRILEQTLIAGKRAGFDLPEETKEELVRLSSEISLLSQTFKNNCRKEAQKVIRYATKDELIGLPQRLLDYMKVEVDGETKYKLTADRALVPEVLEHCSNRKLREELYRAYKTRNLGGEFDNTKTCVDLVNLETKRAHLYGDKCIADRVLSTDHMLNSTQKVYEFLDKLVGPVKAKAVEEQKQLLDFIAKIEGSDFVVEPWDYSYYSVKLKESLFDIDTEKIREYFNLDSVLEGLFYVATKLYGIKFQKIDVPVYHEDVVVYEVYEEDVKFKKRKHLALLYMDLYCREGKSQGAWETDDSSQGLLGGIFNKLNTRPFVFLNTNFLKGDPTLLSLDDVETLFHEFGHSLQAMLSDVEYGCQCCNNVAIDYVELASQFMEHYAISPEFLDKYAKHYKTGESISTEALEKIINSRNFRSGCQVLRQLEFDYLDLKWFTTEEPLQIQTVEDIVRFEEETLAFLREGTGIKYIEGACHSTSFSHIFGGGYSAGYYSYMWTDVLSADAYAYFEELGIFNPIVSSSFRENILSKGDSEDPMKLYVEFRGKEPEVDALLREKGLIG